MSQENTPPRDDADPQLPEATPGGGSRAWWADEEPTAPIAALPGDVATPEPTRVFEESWAPAEPASDWVSPSAPPTPRQPQPQQYPAAPAPSGGASPAWNPYAPGPYGQNPHQQTPYRPNPYQQAPYAPAPYAPAPHGQGPAPTGSPTGRGASWGRWIGTGALALVLGTGGGFVGGLVAHEVDRSSATTPGGLADTGVREDAPLEVENGSIAAVAQQLLPSTVQILAMENADDSSPSGTGSGFVLDSQGHVVTNNHVVEGAVDGGRLVVVDSEGSEYSAAVVGRSPVYDLAVLRLEEPGDLPPAALGGSRQLRVGEGVVAFGAPLGLSQTVTSGIVSALNRPVSTGDDSSGQSFINAVQTDAAINPGNSGGPLVNMQGQVVGINTAIATAGGFAGEAGSIGVGFAIPIAQVRTTADQILKTGEAQYPVIGASVATGASTGGARINGVDEKSPAAEAGLADGDVVVSIEGQRVSDGIALIVAIRTHQPGETVQLGVRRGEKERTVEVTLSGRVG